MSRWKSPALRRSAATVAAAVIVWLIAGRLLPGGLPFGIVLYGVLLGGLSSLTAVGLVVVYRSARVVNFAQAEIGGLAASVAVLLVLGWHVPYFLAVAAGLAVALATGALVDLALIRRLFGAPRLTVTVATIALSQLLGALELGLPGVFGRLSPLATFTTPFGARFTVGPMVFDGDDVVAMVVVPIVLAGLAWFFGRSQYGVAIRGTADSRERALLLGIPVARLSTMVWVVAAGLSGVASILTAPILGPQVGSVGGAEALLVPLAAAVVARMESIPIAVVASIGIGVFEQAVFWSYPRSTSVELGLFVIIVGAMLLQRRQIDRRTDGHADIIGVRQVRPIPAALRRRPEVRAAGAGVFLLLAGVAVLWPLFLPGPKVTLFSYVAIFAILAVSIVVLTGWNGQISLGQFAFAGIGAGVSAGVYTEHHGDLFICLALGALGAATAAVLVGLPAVRLSGLFLAVTSLAFAVAVSDYLLDSANFPTFAPSIIIRPYVLGRLDLDSDLTFYYFCLSFLVLCTAVAWNYRRSRAGRVALAARDNERAAAAYGISPLRTKLAGYAISGAMAGLAGGLYAVALRGIPFSGFNPSESIDIFVMVVIGGMGSLAGGITGAIYVQGVQYFVKGAPQLLATGLGLLVILWLLPGGLAPDVMYRVRDWCLRRWADRRGIDLPTFSPVTGVDTPTVTGGAGPGRVADALLTIDAVDAGYGSTPVLFGIDLEVGRGELVGLLGTNGAGKSTLLKVAAGLLPAKRGSVVFDGHDISQSGPVERVRRGMAMVPGGRGVFASLTVAENLQLGAWTARKDRTRVAEATARALSLFPSLAARLDVKAGSLSGGEQQMVALAQALFSRPRLLLIDELSLGLAPAVVADLMTVLRSLSEEGVTVVVVEQSLNVATSIARRSVFMERGQIRFSGPTAQLASEPTIARAVFLGAGSPTGDRSVGPAKATRRAGESSLEVVGVSRSFGGVTALREVSFTLGEGEVLGIIGANGAGKTTLFDICSGFLTPDGGRVRLGGQDISRASAAERADRGLGRVFQDARLFPSLTVSETVRVALERHLEVRDPFLGVCRTGAVSRSERMAGRRADELIEQLGLHDYRDAFVAELSTGTRRVVELACVLAHDPKVLLLDEPSSGIAQRETEALGAMLADLHRRTGASFVIIEHDVPLVSRLADRLIGLHLGQVIADGPPEEVLADPRVIEAYLGPDAVAVARSGLAAPAPGSAPARRRRPDRPLRAATRPAIAPTVTREKQGVR